MDWAKNILATKDPLLAWQAGNMAAVWDGLHDALAKEPNDALTEELKASELVPVPRWVVSAAVDYIRATIPTYIIGKTRNASWVKRYRQDQIDLDRYLTVMRYYRLDPDCESLDDAIERAQEAIAKERGFNGKRAAAGKEDTIRSSYKRVLKAFREDQGGRYYRSHRMFYTGMCQEDL